MVTSHGASYMNCNAAHQWWCNGTNNRRGSQVNLSFTFQFPTAYPYESFSCIGRWCTWVWHAFCYQLMDLTFIHFALLTRTSGRAGLYHDELKYNLRSMCLQHSVIAVDFASVSVSHQPLLDTIAVPWQWAIRHKVVLLTSLLNTQFHRHVYLNFVLAAGGGGKVIIDCLMALFGILVTPENPLCQAEIGGIDLVPLIYSPRAVFFQKSKV